MRCAILQLDSTRSRTGRASAERTGARTHEQKQACAHCQRANLQTRCYFVTQLPLHAMTARERICPQANTGKVGVIMPQPLPSAGCTPPLPPRRRRSVARRLPHAPSNAARATPAPAKRAALEQSLMRLHATQRTRLRNQRVQPQRRRNQVAHARVARRRRRCQRGYVFLPVPPWRQEVWADNHGARAVRNARVERVGDCRRRLRMCAASDAPQRARCAGAPSHQLHVRCVHHRPPSVRLVRVHEAQLCSSGAA